MGLFSAIKSGNLQFMRKLLSKPDVDVNVRDRSCVTGVYRTTPLHLAIFLRRSDIVHMLIEHEGIDLNADANHGVKPLHLAASLGNLDAVECLLQTQKVSISAEEGNGRTALHLAALNGNAEIVEKLLQTDEISITKMDKYGQTALHLAAFNGNAETVEKLLQIKGIPSMKEDNMGQTALDLAVFNGKQNAAILLLKHNLKYNELPSLSRLDGYIRWLQGQLDTFLLLAEEKQEVNRLLEMLQAAHEIQEIRLFHFFASLGASEQAGIQSPAQTRTV